jgi:hypothetical protein
MASIVANIGENQYPVVAKTRESLEMLGTDGTGIFKDVRWGPVSCSDEVRICPREEASS